jgi:hypothetical protein
MTCNGAGQGRCRDFKRCSRRPHQRMVHWKRVFLFAAFLRCIFDVGMDPWPAEDDIECKPATLID